MAERLRTTALRLLRVPPEPHPPAGDPSALRMFRASPRFYRYRLALWAIGQVGALAGIIGGLIFLEFLSQELEPRFLVTLLRLGEAVAIVGFLVQLLLGLTLVRLDFELRWYILSDRSLRIREGILSLHEKTMTFANIQGISIRQNPLQRLLGIADVRVRTAGGGGGEGEDAKEGLHEAYFRGVDNAEEIRTAIRDRVRRHRDSGLGDPDDVRPPSPSLAGDDAALAAGATNRRASAAAGAAEDPAVAAARTVLEEARALRRALRPAGSPE